MKLRYVVFCLPLVLNNLSACDFPGVTFLEDRVNEWSQKAHVVLNNLYAGDFPGETFLGDSRNEYSEELRDLLPEEGPFKQDAKIGNDFRAIIFNGGKMNYHVDSNCIGCLSLADYNTFSLNNELLGWYAQRTMGYEYNSAYQFLCRNSDTIFSKENLNVLASLQTEKATATVEQPINVFFLADMLHERNILHTINIKKEQVAQMALKSIESIDCLLRSIDAAGSAQDGYYERGMYAAIRKFIAQRTLTYQ
jgi:hypothetical protein